MKRHVAVAVSCALAFAAIFMLTIPARSARAQAGSSLSVSHSFDPTGLATIQDFAIFKDELYILASDYIMDGPAFEVCKYDPEKKQADDIFGPREVGSDEEGGYRMNILKGRLCVMGPDSRLFFADGLGKATRYYRFDGESWDYRNVRLSEGQASSWALHMLYVIEYGDKLFASVGTIDRKGMIWESADDGATWNISYQTKVFPEDFPRMFEMAEFKGKLYANGRAQRLPDCGIDLWEYDGSKWTELDIVKGSTYVWRFGVFKDHLYISAYMETGPRMYRFDGKTMRELKDFKNIVNGFAELDKRFYAIDSSGVLWSTTDGASWKVALRLPQEEFVGKTDAHQRSDLMRGALISFKGSLFVGSAVNGKVFIVDKK